ncbi:glycoside hydrolase family 125 protein [Flavobacterium sp. IB48]|uniref:glycoside hydrolase family 125 protein n=1 Tax=Flavobacterium sp. IB48 TaxID=2779375 RepID=UPI0018E84D12|nr:glycoside hydrolase family 125 protein [Flavobacterium sp. IB48]MBJ2126746.1 glycoside hydrolase family 125 protein [Flavobacterium sp. IB48]
MQSRRKFIKNASIFSAGLLAVQADVFGLNSNLFEFPLKDFITKRPPLAERKFTSKAIEAAIVKIKKQIANPQLAWLFENCFPNTLDTTVEFEIIDGKPDTYVITGDIDAMWLRDSTAQIWPYIPFVKEDAKLAELVKGVINRQTKCILLDPYANAFYKDFNKESEWKNDITDMKPGIHERKWEIDSLCYPVRLAHGYWKETGDISMFDKQWKDAMKLILKTFKEQQRMDGKGGPYSFMRQTAWATDGVPLSGYGYPVKPCGLIVSTFRPSDDSTLFGYLIPSNMFAIEILGYLVEMFSSPALKDNDLAAEAKELQAQVQKGLNEYGIIDHPKFGKIIAFEVNGYGSFHMMDDANVPSLLSLPYLGAVSPDDPLYLNTRKVVLSENNPFFYKGTAGEGIGGPHTGVDTIWPMSIVLRAITSIDEKEIKSCISTLIKTNANTGFMHESFHKDDVTKFTRKWFAWANTLFGEMIVHTSLQYPQILKDKNL